MIKKMQISPEKLILMGSGCAFLFLIVPAWAQGFLWAAVSAVILCLTVWRLPVSGERIRGLLTDKRTQAVSLILGLGFGCNFYNTWQDSRYVGGIAGVLGWETESFLLTVAAAVVLLSVPAVSCALSYFWETAVRDYRKKKSAASGRGIPAGRAFLILLLIYGIGISAIVRADYFYRDDLGRVAFGYKQWDYFSRYLSTALATLVHGGDYLVDAAPMPQLLAVALMAAAGIVLLYVIFDRTEFSLWEIGALVPMGLSPYFLECLSYRFDAPYMVVSVLAAVLPLLLRRGRPVAYLLASMLGILAVCTSYQAATGLFPMLVIFLMLRMWNQGKSLREVFAFCGISAAGYILGMVFFLLVLMRPADAGYVSNTIPGSAGFVENTLKNLELYWNYVTTDFPDFWLLLMLLAAVVFLVETVCRSLQKKAAALAVAAVCLLAMALLSFGIYPFLAEPVFAPRAMYGFGVLLTLFGITAAEDSRKILQKLPVLILSWLFVVFAFTYGNALTSQKEYTDFRVRLVIEDLAEMEVFREEPVTVQIVGSIDKAPVLREKARKDRILLDRLLPRTFGNTGEWERYNFYYYYDLRNVVWDRSVNLRNMDLPVIKDTMYHTIRGEGTNVLIQLK